MGRSRNRLPDTSMQTEYANSCFMLIEIVCVRSQKIIKSYFINILIFRVEIVAEWHTLRSLASYACRPLESFSTENYGNSNALNDLLSPSLVTSHKLHTCIMGVIRCCNIAFSHICLCISVFQVRTNDAQNGFGAENKMHKFDRNGKLETFACHGWKLSHIFVRNSNARTSYKVMRYESLPEERDGGERLLFVSPNDRIEFLRPEHTQQREETCALTQHRQSLQQ